MFFVIIIKNNEKAIKMLYIDDNLNVMEKLKRENKKYKMIFFDPPYNTCSRQSYKDCMNKNEWKQFIIERLKLTKDLLQEDGVILMAINYKMFHHLKCVAEDIFDEKNFINEFVWVTKESAQGIPTKNLVVNNHEYILVYGKDKNKFKYKGKERDLSTFKKDEGGYYKVQYLQRFNQGFKEVEIELEDKIHKFETPYTKEKIEKWKEEGLLFSTGKYIGRKEYIGTYKNNKQLTTFLGTFLTKEEKERLKKELKEKGIEFNFMNPKPVKLLKFLVEQTTNKNDNVLDCFAGSGNLICVCNEMERNIDAIQLKENGINEFLLKRFGILNLNN